MGSNDNSTNNTTADVDENSSTKQKSDTNPPAEQKPNQDAQVQPPESSPTVPSAKQPNIFHRFAALFSRSNPHYKRNRWILALCSLVLISLIVVAIIFALLPALNGELSITNVTPTEISDGILGAKSHFVVTTEHGSVDKVRNAIYLEPAIDYEVKELIPGSSYEIIPTSDLIDNTVFNVDSVSNDVIAYKWAFQTKKDLSVSKIYPANGANYVSENTVIEFSFSYPDVENVADHFSISPQVPGHLKKLERSWRFTPDEPLAKDATYEITISAGLTYGEETMLKDFHSTFSTFEHQAVVTSAEEPNKGITLDGVSYFTEKDNPVIVFEGVDHEYFQNSEYVDVEKTANVDDFIKHLKGEQVNTESVGRYDFTKNEISTYSIKYATLNQTLPTGYYILHFKSSGGQDLYTANIEVNNLAAYAFESERDVIVWVAEDGELKSGIKVNYQGKNYETGTDGLLKIENTSDYSDSLDYMKIGNSEQPLAISLKDFKNDLYPQGFIYTDRLLYNPNDTIKVWGYIPLSFFKDSPKRDGFSIVFGDDIKQYIEVDEEGFFSCDIKLDNHQDEVRQIQLNYDNQELARRWISIENYSLENYSYEFISSKNYVNAGEDINFAVRVTHVTGLPAINKDIVVTYKNNDYYATTNGEGEANFSLPTEHSTATWGDTSGIDSVFISVKSGGAEYNKYSTNTTFYIFKNNMKINGTKDANSDSLSFTAKTLDLSKPVETNYSLKNLEQSDYNGPGTIRLIESRTSRHINGYHYNEYTKENTPTYSTNTTESIIGEYPVEFVNGQMVYNYPTEFKDPEENAYYSYYAIVSITDSTGRPAFSSRVNYYSNYYLGENGNYFGSNAIVAWQSYNPTRSMYYSLYRFGLKDDGDQTSYSLNDTIRLGLYDYSGASIENKGKVLAIAYQENVISENIFTDNVFDIKFDQKLYPGAEIAGAYFIGGRFNRIAPAYYDYDEKDSELAINIETDKTNYEPGDTVKAKVIVTRPDGSRAGGIINLSVVNEAIFNAMEDNTSILSSIYSNKRFKTYSMSTYRDYELLAGGGLGSATGGRADFGDTIFFGSKNLSNGEAEFEFKLNDSITSFRLTALAVENGNVINAGAGTAKIASYLPLSISTVMPKRVKNTDDLVLNATSITSQGDQIDYTFTIEELDKVLTASASPGQSVYVNFGKLDLGSYTIIIEAKDSSGNTDKMAYPLEIIETAQEVTVKNSTKIDGSLEITPAKNPIIVEFYDEDTKHYVDYLDFLEDNQTERLDTLVAYYKSLDYRNKYYSEAASIRVPIFDSYMAQDGTLKPLNSAEGDYILTALVNYYAPGYLDLKASNYGINLDDDTSTVVQKLLVLASFKEPVLLDLKAIATSGLSLTEEDKALLGIAFAFIGDYNSAANLYSRTDAREDLLAILSSFIDKADTVEQIDHLIKNDPASDYLPFAIISFMANNEVDLSKEETIEVTVNAETNRITLHPLEIVQEVYHSDNLASLKFTTGADNIFANYHYQGGISELSDEYATDIVTKLDNVVVGQTATLTIDISALDNRNGSLNIALPSNLKFSATFSGKDGVYLIRNNHEYVKLSLSDYYEDNVISIPLYVAMPGNYKLEPVIFDGEDGYHTSESIVFDAN